MSRLAPAWVYLPALGGALIHAPILKWDLAPQLRRPIDGGATFRGKPVFGANKTWRGAIAMTLGPTLATIALARTGWRERIPPGARAANPAALGALLGLSVWAGELPNSFLKRQLGIAPGTQRESAAGTAISILDQGDFVLTSALLLRPVWRMSARDVAVAFGTVAAVHVPVSAIGHAIGARSSAR